MTASLARTARHSVICRCVICVALDDAARAIPGVQKVFSTLPPLPPEHRAMPRSEVQARELIADLLALRDRALEELEAREDREADDA